jgi:hypothetical protein
VSSPDITPERPRHGHINSACQRERQIELLVGRDPQRGIESLGNGMQALDVQMRVNTQTVGNRLVTARVGFLSP